MEQKILVLAGPKQSGKTTAANFVVGYTLSQLGRSGIRFCPTNFDIDDNGKLLVNTSEMMDDGKIEESVGILDLNSMNDEFIRWASVVMWPYIKTYAFADILKSIAITVFGLTYEQVYGTDEQKDSFTNIPWKNMARLLHAKQVSNLRVYGKYDKNMTAREFLQYFGTNVCRTLFPECWIRSCLDRIIVDCSEMAIIQDCRFKNELYNSKKLGAKVIKFSRTTSVGDIHDSEVDLSDVPDTDYDLVLPPKEELSIIEQNKLILDSMRKWGWFKLHIGLPGVN